MRCRACNRVLPPGASQCDDCGLWNVPGAGSERAVSLAQVEAMPEVRYVTGLVDKCFGGGIVQTSVTLISGQPGAGKSTMLLQIANNILEGQAQAVLLISAEEDASQIKARADRLNLANIERIYISDARKQRGSSLTGFLELAADLVILDSLPAFIGIGPGTDQLALELIQEASEAAGKLRMPILIIDHITKDDDFAGRMILQHEVDALMHFRIITEGPRGKKKDVGKRILETKKNRFGPAPVSQPFLMTGEGIIAVEEDE